MAVIDGRVKKGEKKQPSIAFAGFSALNGAACFSRETTFSNTRFRDDGSCLLGDKIVSAHSERKYEVMETGIMYPEQTPTASLYVLCPTCITYLSAHKESTYITAS